MHSILLNVLVRCGLMMRGIFLTQCKVLLLEPVVQKVDNANHWINYSSVRLEFELEKKPRISIAKSRSLASN